MEQRFERKTSSLSRIFTFVEDFAEAAGIRREVMLEVNLAIEEIFTNMVKYSTESRQPVDIELISRDGLWAVTITDRDVEPFDVTAAKSRDMETALLEGATGGRGLFLVRQVMDEITYEYDKARRISRIMMTRALEKRAADNN